MYQTYADKVMEEFEKKDEIFTEILHIINRFTVEEISMVHQYVTMVYQVSDACRYDKLVAEIKTKQAMENTSTS